MIRLNPNVINSVLLLHSDCPLQNFSHTFLEGSEKEAAISCKGWQVETNLVLMTWLAEVKNKNSREAKVAWRLMSENGLVLGAYK